MFYGLHRKRPCVMAMCYGHAEGCAMCNGLHQIYSHGSPVTGRAAWRRTMALLGNLRLLLKLPPPPPPHTHHLPPARPQSSMFILLTYL